MVRLLYLLASFSPRFGLQSGAALCPHESLISMPFLSRILALLVLSLSILIAACGPGDTSTSAATVPTITTQPTSVASTGDVATVFKVVATGGALTYQWYQDNVAITDATQSSYATSTAGSYYVVVSNTLGKVTSLTVTLAISVDPVITVQPQAGTITTGKSTALAVVATGARLSYQWYLAGVVLSGATGTTYMASTAGSYTVVVSSARTGAKSVTSNAAIVTVSTTSAAPTLATQPKAISAIAGTAVSFAVNATGTDLTYQWFKDTVAITSATSPTYAIDSVAAVNAGTYYVVVTNTLGFVASNAAALTVTPVGSGSNTAVVVAAANAFLGTLTAGQHITADSPLSTSTVLFGNSLSNARVWTDAVGSRHGLRLNTTILSLAQLNAADALIATALSPTGATLMSEIRVSDDAVAHLSTTSGAGAGLYSIAFIGQPSTTLPWTLQLTGHQLTYNITYNAPLISATPMVMGAQPPNWTFSSAGVYTVNNTANTAVSGTTHAAMENQRLSVSSLVTSLQSSTATFAAAKLLTSMSDLQQAPSSTSDEIYKTVGYPTGTTGRGVLVSTLTAAQQAAVTAVVQAWVKTQATDVAETLLGAYLTETALASTYVAYAPGAGGTVDFGAFPNASALPGSAGNSYLRIDGPRVWIEFIVKSESTLTGNVYYRSVWRDKLADYGGQY